MCIRDRCLVAVHPLQQTGNNFRLSYAVRFDWKFLTSKELQFGKTRLINIGQTFLLVFTGRLGIFVRWYRVCTDFGIGVDVPFSSRKASTGGRISLLVDGPNVITAGRRISGTFDGRRFSIPRRRICRILTVPC